MAAAEGNTYALKWDKETVLSLLDKMQETAQDKDIVYLGELLASHKLYKEIWSYWKDKFKNDEDVFQPIKTIEQLFESRLFKGALKGDYNATTAIFGLKNNHKWTDQPQVESQGENTIPLNIEGKAHEGKKLATSEEEIDLKKDDRYAQ